MISLIKKDFLMVRWIFIIYILMMLLSAPLLLLSKNELGFYTLFIFENLMLTIVICNTEIAIEKKSKTDIFITSLPIERKVIVGSKYIIFGIIPLISNVLDYLVVVFSEKYSFLSNVSNLQDKINPAILFISFSICLIYVGIYIALNYYLEENSKIIEYILLLSLFLIPELFDKISIDSINTSIMEGIFSTGTGLIASITIIISLIIYFVSYKVSVAIYDKKEF